MYTFNFGIIFGKTAVHTIVCASEDPIDEFAVTSLISERLPVALASKRSASNVVSEVAKAIKEEFGYQAVTVKADAAVHVMPVK